MLKRSLLLCLLGLGTTFAAASADVLAYEKEIVIPTWEIGPPQVHSNFSDSGADIYPYTLQDVLTNNKVDKTYKGVFLENEYIQILILPEIGGRIHGALDKTNGYKWLYWQPTIKPGLISMTGAWISGGVEWNFPHGHRPSCFMPVDSKIVHHPDGAATVWVGETEPIFRMRWAIGLTVFPGRSHLRTDYIFSNPTDHKHSFQFWATSATHANEWTQAQYPGDMVAGHGKHRFWNWPIHDGVDLTWWKNSPNASSYFAFNNPSDWFGTYDHSQEAGMIHTANHHIMPGKKLWTWGSGPSGRIWEDILTEGGGPYFEPQAGAWSDNQPDYHWMQPHEVKTARSYWLPVRDTRGVHMADRNFALNTDLQDGRAFGAVYAAGRFPGCKVILKNARTGEVLSEAAADLAPDRPYTVETPAGEAEVYDLHLSVIDQNGSLLIELQQQKPKQVELPEGQRDPGDPKKMNADELYYAGEWLDKFRRTNQALTYYREALKRDPSDARINAEMGFYSLKQGKWMEALDYFQTALQRDGDNARLYFGCGVAWRQLGDLDEACNQFYRATYSQDCYSQAYFNLAKIDLARGDYKAAVEKLDEAAGRNGKFADIPALQAAAFRRAGKNDPARIAADKALSLDPLHFMGGYEKSFSGGEAENDWRSVMRDSVQNYLELSAAYAGAGLLQDADRILALYVQDQKDEQINPMVNYFRGYFKIQSGDKEKAAEFFRKARLGAPEYVNPHRLEGKAALEAALQFDPADANAHLFLGSLLYAKGQREDGFAHWREALKANPEFVLAWRSVAYAERRLNNDPQASYQAYQKAARLAPRDARILFEFDQAAEAAGASYAARLDFLLDHLETVQTRDNLIARLVDLRLIAGDKENLQNVYNTLHTHHFHSWEGRYEIHHGWVEVNQKLGDLAFKNKNYSDALQHYEEACLYPKNLEVAPRTPDFRAHVYWNLAKTHRAMNHEGKSRAYLQKIIAEQYNSTHIGVYYQALAYKDLGDGERSRALFDQIEKHLKQIQSGGFEYRGRAQTIGHYLSSLLLEEKGDLEGSKAELEKALERDPRVMRSAIREAQLDIARAHQ